MKKILIELEDSSLRPWQKTIVNLALHRGSSALFKDCGLGKTIELPCRGVHGEISFVVCIERESDERIIQEVH